MKTSSSRNLARYAGIGLALCIPALVLAQTLPDPDNLQAGDILRAQDLLQMRDALQSALSSITRLEGQAGVPFTKAEVYERVDTSEPIPQNLDGTASAACDNTNDILIGCSCQGRQGTANSLQLDLRQVTMNNARGNTSSCTCQAVNVGTNVSRTVVATAQCVPGP